VVEIDHTWGMHNTHTDNRTGALTVSEKDPPIDLAAAVSWLHGQTRRSVFARHAQSIEIELTRLRGEVAALNAKVAFLTDQLDVDLAVRARMADTIRWHQENPDTDLHLDRYADHDQAEEDES
jgi:hypothetical protein